MKSWKKSEKLDEKFENILISRRKVKNKSEMYGEDKKKSENADAKMLIEVQ